jgi:hypothetical protein
MKKDIIAFWKEIVDLKSLLLEINKKIQIKVSVGRAK